MIGTFVKSPVLDIFIFEMPMKGNRRMASGKVRKWRKDLGGGHIKYSLIHLTMKLLECHFQKRKWIGVVRKAEMGSLIRKLWLEPECWKYIKRVMKESEGYLWDMITRIIINLLILTSLSHTDICCSSIDPWTKIHLWYMIIIDFKTAWLSVQRS